MDSPRSIFTPWSSRDWPPGWTVCRVAETGSTNVDVLAALDAGTIGDRTVLVAGRQTAGRGRLDRRWDAPADANLLVTLAFTGEGERPHVLAQRVALAALGAARRWPRAEGERYGVKWPNDLLVRVADGPDRKLAGLLAQRSRGGVAVGIGINVGWAPPGAARLGSDDPDPDDGRDDSDDGRDDSDGDAPSAGIAVADVLAALLYEFDALPRHDDDLLAAYRRDLLTLGTAVRVELPDDSTFDGTAVDIDADGRLVVQAVGAGRQRRSFDVGDVVHLRPVD